MTEAELKTSLGSPVVYRDLDRIIRRQWSGCLTASENAVVSFIFDRTIGWAKETERITWKHFLDGVTSRDVCYTGGLNMSRATLGRALKSLKERGAISAEDGNYGINFDWKPAMLRVPKRLKKRAGSSMVPDVIPSGGEEIEDAGVSHIETKVPQIGENKVKKVSQNETKVSQIDNTSVSNLVLNSLKTRPKERTKKRGQRREENIREVNTRRAPHAGGSPAPSPLPSTSPLPKNSTGDPLSKNSVKPTLSELEEVATRAMGRSAAQRQKKVDRVLGKPCGSAAEVRLVWDYAVSEICGVEPVTHTRKDYTILHQYGLRYSRDKKMFGVYMTWCVRHWRHIVKTRLNWMRKSGGPPLVPTIRFFVGMSQYFESFYTDQKKIEGELGRTTRETLVVELVAQGYPQDIAERDADERLGMGEQARRLERATRARALQQQSEERSRAEAEREESRKRQVAEWARKRDERMKKFAGVTGNVGDGGFGNYEDAEDPCAAASETEAAGEPDYPDDGAQPGVFRLPPGGFGEYEDADEDAGPEGPKYGKSLK